MKLVEGGVYRTRNGRKAIVKSVHVSNGCLGHVDGYMYGWCQNGLRNLMGDSHLDIVAEWSDPEEAPAPAPEPEWIPWIGGDRPVHPEAYVEITAKDLGLGCRRVANCVDWSRGAVWPVTAYRVLWSPPAEKPKRSGEVWVKVIDALGDIYVTASFKNL